MKQEKNAGEDALEWRDDNPGMYRKGKEVSPIDQQPVRQTTNHRDMDMYNHIQSCTISDMLNKILQLVNQRF